MMEHESENQGMKMNKSKTTAMTEKDTPIRINTTHIQTKTVELYVYLGQHHRHKPNGGGGVNKYHARMDRIRQAPRHLQG